MKHFALLLVSAAAIFAAAPAQAQPTPRTATTASGPMDLQNGDRFVMKNGAVVRQRNGQITGLNENVRLPNGTKVNVKSGIVELTNGKMTTLAEGDYVKADGGIVFATPQSAAAARGETAPADAQFTSALERPVTPSTTDVETRLGALNQRVDLMARKIQLLNQKISLLSQNNPKAPNTSQLDAEIKTLDEQLRAVK